MNKINVIPVDFKEKIQNLFKYMIQKTEYIQHGINMHHFLHILKEEHDIIIDENELITILLEINVHEGDIINPDNNFCMFIERLHYDKVLNDNYVEKELTKTTKQHEWTSYLWYAIERIKKELDSMEDIRNNIRADMDKLGMDWEHSTEKKNHEKNSWALYLQFLNDVEEIANSYNRNIPHIEGNIYDSRCLFIPVIKNLTAYDKFCNKIRDVRV